MQTQTETIAGIAARSLAAVRVLEGHGIDYCCGGQRALEEVCREKGVPPETLLAEIRQAEGGSGAEERDWTKAPLAELIRHIVDRHHSYLTAELPRVAQRLNSVIQAHGESDGIFLKPLAVVFDEMRQEIEMHMHKEEMVLFPYIERCEEYAKRGAALPPPPFGTVANPIRMMEHEHETVGQALRRMRELTGGYRLPEHACGTYRALYAGLAEMESDLHLHIHLENNILFPRALEVEGGGR